MYSTYIKLLNCLIGLTSISLACYFKYSRMYAMSSNFKISTLDVVVSFAKLFSVILGDNYWKMYCSRSLKENISIHARYCIGESNLGLCMNIFLDDKAFTEFVVQMTGLNPSTLSFISVLTKASSGFIHLR